MSRKRSVALPDDDVQRTGGEDASVIGCEKPTSEGGKGKRYATETADGSAGRSRKGFRLASESGVPPTAARRAQLSVQLGTRGPAAGIKNLGATCYINSLLQSLYMTPELRRHVLEWHFEPKQRHTQNLAYQLQVLFHAMSHPRRAFVDAKALIDSFGMGTAAYRQQHDVQELNRKLLDVLQTLIDRAGGTQVIKHLYEGDFADYKRCQTCKAVTSSPSPYQDLSVAIQGVPTLEEALRKFTTPDEIEGVTCDNCDAKRTVEKGLAYRTFPQVLTIQLRRIDYNLQTYEREKVKQDVKLPLTLDVRKLLDQDGVNAAGAVPSTFKLQTVIAHSGTAYFGHYYAFARVETHDGSAAATAVETGEPATDATVGGCWVKFNDDNITIADPEHVEEYIDPASWKARGVARDKLRQASKQAADGAEVAAVPGTSTTDEGMGKAVSSTDPEDAAVMAGLFNEADAGASSTIYEKTPGGSSYYAIYRRSDLPDVTLDELASVTSYNIPDYIRDAARETDATLDHDAAELANLRSVICVGLVYRGLVRWIDTAANATIDDLITQARTVFNIDGAIYMRLRSYSTSLERCGEAWSPTARLVEDLGCKPQANSYCMLGVETTSSEHTAHVVWPAQHLKEWDGGVDISVYDSDAKTFITLKKRFEAQNHLTTPVDEDDDGQAIRPLFQPVTFPANASAAEVLQVISEKTGIAPDELQASAVIERKAYPLLVDAACGAPRDLSVPYREFFGKNAFVDTLLVERTSDAPGPADIPSAITVPHPWLMLRGYVHIESTYLMTVHVRYHGDQLPAEGDDGGDAGDGEDAVKNAATTGPQAVFDISIDGRKMLHELKARICEHLEVKESDVQMLVDTSRRELPTLMSTIRGCAFGMKTLTVNVVNGAPLAADEAYAELYVATNRLMPAVVFMGKVLIKDSFTIDDIIAAGLKHPKAAHLGLDPALPGLCRARLMPPNRTSVLGVPMLKNIVKDNTTSHSFDELRVVLQPLSEAPKAPLSKSTLILTLYHWDSTAQDSRDKALSRRHEFVTAKDAPVRDLVLAICAFLDVKPPAEVLAADPASAKEDKEGDAVSKTESNKEHDTTAPAPSGEPPIEFARAKPFQLIDHRSVATKLPWGLVDILDPADLKRSLGGFPLRLEQDDIIVVRRPTEPWPDGIVQCCGIVVGGGVVVSKTKKKKGAADSKGDGVSESGGKGGKRHQRDEPGLHLRAVWDYEGDVSSEAPKTADGDVPQPTVTTAPESGAPATTEGLPSESTAGPSSAVDTTVSGTGPSSCGDIAARLPQLEYAKELYGDLEEICAVCMCDLEENEKVVILPSCHHVFHASCVAPWVNDHGNCPKCLQLIIMDD
jgi:ubiquitin C-terminal hydrolase